MVTPLADPAPPLPAGVATFLFTDIEGSTRLAHELGVGWLGVLQNHHRILRAAFTAHRGTEVSTAGDSFFVAFASASDAVAASVTMQRAIAAHDWSPHAPLRVRMGLHTGRATLVQGDYAGLNVHAAARVESAASGGQVLITEATLEACGTLAPGIDVVDLGQHRLKDLPTELHLFQLVADGLDRDFAPVRSLEVLRNNVPVPASNFVGRVDALATAHRLLDQNRLVTLVGPAGAGKTRLALKLAVERLHRYRDGVWFVELDPARDDVTTTAALAAVLRVEEQPGRPLTDALVDHLRDRDVLVVLDNCEHVVDAAARLVDRVVRAGNDVHVMATSREPLAVGGERLVPVAPLSTDAADPRDSEAVRLLVDRVQLAQPEFTLTDDDLPAAVAICRRLDGLPLALELAAASATLLALPAIAERLDQRFDLLTRGSRTALDRQRTLWGAIDWSYDLLDERARGLFRRLGVFPGEFDVATVAGVLGERRTTVDSLASLVDKSLVARAPSGRLRLLESIRAYARDRLAEHDEVAAVAELHARWFAAHAITVGSPTVAGELDLLEVVHDDLTVALDWTVEHDGLLALQMLSPLHHLWRRSGRWTQGREISSRVLDATANLRGAARVSALELSLELARKQSDFATARTMLDELIAIKREIGDDSHSVDLLHLATLTRYQGDLVAAEQLATQCLDEVRETNPNLAATALTHLTEIARQRGDFERAWEVGNEALGAARAIDRQELVVYGLNQLGTVARQRGDPVDARRLHDEALAAARTFNDTAPVPYILYCLATVALDDGAKVEAASRLTEAITLGRDLDARADLAESLEATARLARMGGDYALACRLFGATDALRITLGFPHPPADAAEHQHLVDQLQRDLGDVAFAQYWSDGRCLALDAAVTTALAYLEGVA